MMRSCLDCCCPYTVCLSPTLNGSSGIQYFERSDAIEVRNGIIFDFYTGLPYPLTDTLILNAIYTGGGVSSFQPTRLGPIKQLCTLHTKVLDPRHGLKVWV